MRENCVEYQNPQARDNLSDNLAFLQRGGDGAYFCSVTSKIGLRSHMSAGHSDGDSECVSGAESGTLFFFDSKLSLLRN